MDTTHSLFDEKQHVVWWKTTRRLMKNITSFDGKQHVVWWKTTRRLMENNTSFDGKQHVIWWKTTRHLMKNNTSFDEKRHVVWWKTSRRLRKSKYSLTQHDQQGYELQVHSLSYNKCEIAVEHLFPSRARIQEFYHFCCHKCHRSLCISLCYNTLRPYFE